MKIEKYSEFEQQNISEEIDWENIKYKLGKLGSITKGGKFFGRKKQDAKAKEELAALLKDANNKLISDMDKKIKETVPEFPNNKSREQFLEGLAIISATYDSIVISCWKTYGSPLEGENQGKLTQDENGNYVTKLNPGDEGYMTIDMANSVINSLQKYMQRLIDYDLSTSYTIFEKTELSIEDTFVLEAQIQDELDRLNEEISLNPLNWFKKKPEEAALKGGTDTATKKMVHSTKYEKIIGGLGAALGIFGWVVQTDWFRTMMESWLNKPEITKDVVTSDIKNVGMEVKNGEGMTQALNRTLGTDFNKGTSVTEFVDTMKSKGFGNNPTEIFNNLGMESVSPNPNFNADAVTALSRGGNLQNAFSGMFHGKAGTLLALNPGKFLAKQITTQVVKVVVQKAVTTGTTVAAGFAAVGKILLPLGITMVAGAITSWLLKRKAKKSSRYKDLQALLEKMKKLIVVQRKGVVYEDEEEIQIPDSEKNKTGDNNKEENTEKSTLTEKSIYPLMIKNLKALDSLLTSSEGIKLEGEAATSKGKGREAAEGKYKVKRFQKEKAMESLIVEKEMGSPRNVEVTKTEAYLTQAVQNMRKSLKSIQDEKDKGLSINNKFLGDILDKKMDSGTKEPVKQLYAEVYEYLYGSKSKTLGDFGPLYKESVEIISNKGKRQTAAEKIARFAKRSIQFEGEGFYSGLGEFGVDLKEFNETLKQIMDYYKTKSTETKESKIQRFGDYLKS